MNAARRALFAENLANADRIAAERAALRPTVVANPFAVANVLRATQPHAYAVVARLVGDENSVGDVWIIISILAAATLAAEARAVRAAALAAQAARDSLIDTLEYLSSVRTNPAPYERAADDVRAGAAWAELGGGWYEVTSPRGGVYAASAGDCTCPSRRPCRHSALVEAVEFEARIEEAGAWGAD